MISCFPVAPVSGTTLLARNEFRRPIDTNTMEVDDRMTYNGGLAEVTTQRVDDNRIAVKMGRHRVFDIVDGMVVHKSSGNGDIVFAKLSDLKEMLDKQPQSFGVTPK